MEKDANANAAGEESASTNACPHPRGLDDIEPGSLVVVDRIAATGEDAIRLKRMGIFDGSRIGVAQVGDPLIVVAVGCRIGISRRLASTVLVKPAACRAESLDKD